MIWSRKIKIWWIVDMNKVLSSPSSCGATTNSQIPGQSVQCVHSISNNTLCPCDHACPISVSAYCEGDRAGKSYTALPHLHCTIISTFYNVIKRRGDMRDRGRGKRKLYCIGVERRDQAGGNI